jgi:hypothetical protein
MKDGAQVRVVYPALARGLVGQSEHVLEQQQTDHDSGLDPGLALSP